MRQTCVHCQTVYHHHHHCQDEEKRHFSHCPQLEIFLLIFLCFNVKRVREQIPAFLVRFYLFSLGRLLIMIVGQTRKRQCINKLHFCKQGFPLPQKKNINKKVFDFLRNRFLFFFSNSAKGLKIVVKFKKVKAKSTGC